MLSFYYKIFRPCVRYKHVAQKSTKELKKTGTQGLYLKHENFLMNLQNYLKLHIGQNFIFKVLFIT